MLKRPTVDNYVLDDEGGHRSGGERLAVDEEAVLKNVKRPSPRSEDESLTESSGGTKASSSKKKKKRRTWKEKVAELREKRLQTRSVVGPSFIKEIIKMSKSTMDAETRQMERPVWTEAPGERAVLIFFGLRLANESVPARLWYVITKFMIIFFCTASPYLNLELALEVDNIAVSFSPPVVALMVLVLSLTFIMHYKLIRYFYLDIPGRIMRWAPIPDKKLEEMYPRRNLAFHIVTGIMITTWALSWVTQGLLNFLQLNMNQLGSLVLVVEFALGFWLATLIYTILFFVTSCRILEEGVQVVLEHMERNEFEEVVQLKRAVSALAKAVGEHTRHWQLPWFLTCMQMTIVFLFVAVIIGAVEGGSSVVYVVLILAGVFLPLLFLMLGYPARINFRLRKLLNIHTLHFPGVYRGVSKRKIRKREAKKKMRGFGPRRRIVDETEAATMDEDNSIKLRTLMTRGRISDGEESGIPKAGNNGEEFEEDEESKPVTEDREVDDGSQLKMREPSVDSDGLRDEYEVQNRVIATISVLQFARDDLVWRAFGVVVDSGFLAKLAYLSLTGIVYVFSRSNV